MKLVVCLAFRGNLPSLDVTIEIHCKTKERRFPRPVRASLQIKQSLKSKHRRPIDGDAETYYRMSAQLIYCNIGPRVCVRADITWTFALQDHCTFRRLADGDLPFRFRVS